jgi:hypothetical protein
VIAAQPGFDVVLLKHNPYELEYAPVIAWAVVEEPDGADICTSVDPICVDWNNNNLSGVHGVRQPDGSIACTDGATFGKDETAEVLAHMVQTHERRTETRKAWKGTA